MITNLIDQLSNLRTNDALNLADFSDKINWITVLLFLTATMVVGAKQYVLESISCYVGVAPSGSGFDSFLTSYCWVHGTIPLRSGEPFPDSDEQWMYYDKHRRITYYQWVPFVLGLQCIFFYMPHVVWQAVSSNRSGGDLFKLVKLASDAAVVQREDRKKQVKLVAEFVEDMLGIHKDCRRGHRSAVARRAYQTCGICVVSKRMGTCLVFCYIAVKVLALINAVVQLLIIQHFLGFYSGGSLSQKSSRLGQFRDANTVSTYSSDEENVNGFFFGWTVLRHMISGRDWPETLLFPRVAYCRVPAIRLVGVENAYTAQCALPINMLNEKIYIFFWFWIVFLFATILASLTLWFSFMMRTPRRKDLIKRFLRVKNIMSPSGEQVCRGDLDDFTDMYLKRDGVFILRMLALNAGEIVTADVVAVLYTHYIALMKEARLSSNNDVPDTRKSLVDLENGSPPSYV